MREDSSPWHGRRVLVTGCTGLLGSAVTRELLARGADVVGLVRDRARAEAFKHEEAEGRFHIVYGRAEDVFRLHSTMAVYEVSAVFHLAATAPHAVLRAANLYSAPLPIVTAKPLQQLAIAKTEACEGTLSVARFSEVFGPGDRSRRVVPATALSLLTGETLISTERPARDFVFVQDAARACVRVAEDFTENGPGEFAFRSGWLLTESQISSAMRDVFAGQVVQLPEVAPLANPLDWEPQQPFADAVNATLEWMRDSLRSSSTSAIRKAA